MNRSFFNTTNESGDKLKSYMEQALTQEELIMCVFRDEKRPLTPDEVQGIALKGTPLTSVRRAITNLTTKEQLVKTVIKREGSYGRDTYCWKLP
jgi:hypothetical protein